MKRFTLAALIVFVVLGSSNAFAQLQAISVGGGIAKPSGDFNSFAGTGFGGGVRGYYQYEGLDNILLTGAIGYYRFGEKEFSAFGFNSGFGYKWSLIPIMSGGRYYFGQEEASTRFYVGGELGIHIYSVSVSGDDNTLGSATLAGSTDFALIPMVGAQLGPLDVYAEYSISDLNYFGIKGAFKFAVGKK
jgi:hypothetical protein